MVANTLPAGLEVATYEGGAYLGVVPFVMESIRPRGSPIDRSFPELNVRTYVTGPAGPGVYFYSLDAADAIGVTLARRLFSLPYYRAQMRVDRDEDAITITSDRTHGGDARVTFDATYEPTGESFTPVSGSRSAFLLENYRFYTAGRRLYRGEIAHEPWTLRPATVTVRTNSLFEANGFDVPDGDPIAHYAEPIEVTADRLRAV